jgi:hypothetical protein
MTEQELTDLRREHWRLTGHPARTLEDARAFLATCGFATLLPERPPVLLPTLVGAWAGSDDRLPTWRLAFDDARAIAATELMVRLLRDRLAYETNLFGENNPLLVTAAVFPFLYALIGERNPRQAPESGPRSKVSPLACDTFALIQREGPVSKQRMRERLGGSVSLPALDKALGELSATLRITRVDYNANDGSIWDMLTRCAPDVVHEGLSISVGAALSALLSKYIACVVAADQADLDKFLGHFTPRSRIKEAVTLLLNARELEFIRVGDRSLIQMPADVVKPRETLSRRS